MIEELGIGTVYLPNSEEFIEPNLDLLNFVEIEPQTFWFKRSRLGSYEFDREAVTTLLNTKLPVVFHGVGFPVGSYIPPQQEQLLCLKEMMKALSPKWMSEHLSFNSFTYNNQLINTNFLLPPLQTREYIKSISSSMLSFKKELDVPFAFETGANYLKSKRLELPDGYFVSQIAEKADCYILLDLHNLWVNQLNGRQSVDEFVSQIPLERVIEIHLADGFWYKNYYLDAHSGVVSPELHDIALRVISKLPNLKAITFEILPEYLQFSEKESLRNSLEKVMRLWEVRGKEYRVNSRVKYEVKEEISDNGKVPLPSEWEDTLGALSLRIPVTDNPCTALLKNDQGLLIIQDLIDEFRASAIVSILKFTCRYITLSLGEDYLLNLFQEFWAKSSPKLFAIEAGIDFSIFLLNNLSRLSKIIFIEGVIQYEYQSLLAIYENTNKTIKTDFNLIDVIEHIANKKVPPVNINRQQHVITIDCGNLLSEVNRFNAAFHS